MYCVLLYCDIPHQRAFRFTTASPCTPDWVVASMRVRCSFVLCYRSSGNVVVLFPVVLYKPLISRVLLKTWPNPYDHLPQVIPRPIAAALAAG